MKKTRLFATILVPALYLPVIGSFVCGQEKSRHATLGTIERHDPRFDKLIGSDAALEILTGGFDWAQGPVWPISWPPYWPSF